MKLNLKSVITFGEFTGWTIEEIMYAEYDIDANNFFVNTNRWSFIKSLKKDYIFDQDVVNQIDKLFEMKDNFNKTHNISLESSNNLDGNYSHYNDMNTMNDLFFTDLYN